MHHSQHSIPPKKVLINPENGDEPINSADYEDVRCELRATGHNLTSVLLNPRETFLDVLFDEFAIEQSSPLEYPSMYSSTHGSNSSVHNISNESSRGIPYGSSHSSHSNHQITSISQLLVLTQQEIEDLNKFSLKMSKIYDIFQSVHQNHNLDLSIKGSYGTMPGSANGTMVTASVHTNTVPYHQHELAKCYAEIPPVFFQPTFSLKNPDHFQQAMLTYAPVSVPSGTTSPNGNANGNANGGNAVGVIVINGNRMVPVDDMKLTAYLDRLEITLLTQIHNKSARFFHTLDNLKDLSANVTQILTQIHYLRHMMTAMQSNHCDTVFDLVKLHKRQRNCIKLFTKLAALQRFVMTYSALLASLEEEEDYCQGLEYLQILKQLAREELQGIVAIEGMLQGMERMEKVMSEVVSAQFCHFATTPWDDLIATSANTGNGNGNGSGNGNATNGNSSSTAGSSSSGSIATDYLLELDLLTQEILPSTAITPTTLSTNGTTTNTNNSNNGGTTKKENFMKLCSLLVSCNLLEKAWQSYSQRLVENNKLIIRTCIMEYLQGFDPAFLSFLEEDILTASHSNSSSSSSSSTGSALDSESGGSNNIPYVQRIKEMSMDHFLACITMCYEHLRISLTDALQFHVQFIHYIHQYQHNIPESSLPFASTFSSLPLLGHQPSFEEEYDLPLLSTGSVDITASKAGNTNDSTGSYSGRILSIEEQNRYVGLSYQCLVSSMDIIQKTLNQFYSLRKESTAKFPLPKIQCYWTLTWDFIHYLEDIIIQCQQTSQSLTSATSSSLFSTPSSSAKTTEIPGSGGKRKPPTSTSTDSTNSKNMVSAYILRNGMLSQTRLFLDHYHELQKSKLVNCLDHERWISCEIPKLKQLELNAFLVGKTYSPPANTASGSSPFNSHSAGTSAGSSDPSHSSPQKKEKDTISCLLIENKEYKIVWSVLLLYELLTSYLHILSIFPKELLVEIVQKINELCKLFNLRTKQLILGAQAIQSAARLKSISAKHLAMTAQSIHFLLTLLPYLRAYIHSIASSSTSTGSGTTATVNVLLVELDRMHQELFDHHQAILHKFVHMIQEMMEFSQKKLYNMQWDHSSVANTTANTVNAPSTTMTASANCEYLEELVKNITTLHKVLVSILPSDQIRDVFSRIIGILARKLPQYFESIMPNSHSGKQRIVDEISHVIVTLSRLKYLQQEEVDTVFLPLEEWFRHRYLLTPGSASATTTVGSNSDNNNSSNSDNKSVEEVESSTYNATTTR